MKQFSKIIWIWLVLIPVSGCMSVRNASTEIARSEKEVIVIFWAKNVNRVAMIRGVSSDGEFKPNREGFAANIRPENGYVVTQLPETTGDVIYAITQFQIKAGGESYGDCGWKQALTFEGRGGKVIYLGDLDFQAVGKQVSFQHSNNIENARLFVDSNYPKLRGQVEYAEPKVLPHAKVDCDNRAGYEYHIIYLPRRR